VVVRLHRRHTLAFMMANGSGIAGLFALDIHQD
jgi:hypothetical protein